MQKFFLVSFIWIFIYSSFVFASNSEFVTLQEKALGQSLTGASTANDSLYINPASSAFLNVYSIDGTFQLPKNFGVSVVDTKTSGIGGGLGYFRRQMFGTELTQGAKLAFAGKVSDIVGIGIAGKSLWGPTSAVDASGKSIKGQFNNIDAGVLVNTQYGQVGATFRNILSEKPEMGQEREYSIGGRISWDQVMFLSVATQSKAKSLKPYQYGIGAEYVSPYFFALRGGYRSQPYDARAFWGLGASFISPRLALHYAVELPSQNSDKIEHTLGTTLLF